MYNFREDKLLCTDLVRGFPKEMIKEIEPFLVGLSNYNIKGLHGIKGIDDQYQIAFELEKIYKIIFNYYKDKSMSLRFTTKDDTPILNVKNVIVSDKLGLIIYGDKIDIVRL